MNTTTWTGGVASPRAECVMAANPSSMTLQGTNTWLLAEPEADQCIVVDPGPLLEAHLRTILDTVAGHGRRVALTLLTHTHPDHAEAAARFGELTQAPVHAIGNGHADLRDGDVLNVDGLQLRVVATPGHSGDSACFLIPAEAALLTGDTILGWGTTVVNWPDGVLADYLNTLDRLAAMAQSGEVTRLLPGHGAPIDDAMGKIRYYQEHRQERLTQVKEAIDAGAGYDADEILARVYADVPRDVWPAARRSIMAQLDYVRERA